MAVKGRRDGSSSPLFFKFGVALAFSLGGIVFTFIRSKRNMLPRPKPSLPSPGKGSQADSGVAVEHRAMENSSIPRVPSHNSFSDVSSSSGRNVGDRDDFFSLELDQLIKEYDLSTYDVSQKKNVHNSLEHNVKPPKEHICAEHEEHEGELRSLRSKVEILEEREKILENQLLEYYGLKELENTVLELQTQLRVHKTEANLYNLKIKSLQSDNKRLQAEVADYEKVVAELESSQAKINLLRKKLMFEATQNREQVLKLQERVMKLQDQEKKSVEINQDVDTLSWERIQLEELEEMKKYIHSLKLENLELAQKVEDLRILDESALDDKGVQALREEIKHLRLQNENLRKEIDQLQADHSKDVEELVYLRWVSVCLRYELKNYQPGTDENITRDLSVTSSPKSEKMKKFILANANREGYGVKDMTIDDCDCKEWSISQSSYLSDSGEPDDLLTDNLEDRKTHRPSKKKLLPKLMKLLRGKENSDHIDTLSSLGERAESVDEVVSRYTVSSHSGILGKDDGLTKTTTISSNASSFDMQVSYPQGQKSAAAERSNYSGRMIDDGSLNIFRSIDSITEYDDNLLSGSQPDEEAPNAARTELLKNAEALKSSCPKQPFRRRSATFGSLLTSS